MFIRSSHPKTEIQPDPQAIRRVLDQGWWGQIKIHGHRAQIHIPSNAEEPIIVYTRQGGLHKKQMDQAMMADLRRLFQPTEGWNVIEAEWLKPLSRLFIFDFLKREGQALSNKTYSERYDYIPKIFSSDYIETLPLYKSVAKCLEVLDSPESYVEGLVFKAPHSPGFSDTSIIRCRRR